MPWPNSGDYVEALRDSGLCFADDDLIDGEVDVDHNGLPLALVGNSSSVFRVVKNEKVWAVKCFHWHDESHERRYRAIEKALRSVDSRYLIKFEYIKQGVKAAGAWYPIVKMEWVEGESLDSYILSNIQFPDRLANVKRDFQDLLQTLNRAGLAHLDLQHGNLLVQMDRIKLIDYDTFFVPELDGHDSLELGHYNYQHPRRDKQHFNLSLDNFSAWIIFSSLHCITLDTSLWHKLAGGDECLLFRQEDYGDPFKSYAFALLESHSHPEIRNTAKLIRSFCESETSLEAIPSVSEALTCKIDLQPLPPISTVPAWIKAREAKLGKSMISLSHERKTNEGITYGTFKDFNEAVKSNDNFEDIELRNSICCLEDTQIGKNSRVYHFLGEDREIALKCFMSHVPNRQEHYEAIKIALKGGIKDYVAQVYYLPRGIKVNGEWRPALKMDWLKGQTLNQLRKTQINEATASYLADRFAEMILCLRRQGIAHGDLSFDNILLCNNDLKIVDYDSMYVPALMGKTAIETGDPAFQHPRRSLKHFGAYLDNFSSWLIFYMLKRLYVNPSLPELVENCLKDERQADVVKTALRNMELDRKADVKEMAALLKLILGYEFPAVPILDAERSLTRALKNTTDVVKENISSPFLKKKPKN